jgi:hypothetical protein
MARIRRDWYEFAPPSDRQGGAAVVSAPPMPPPAPFRRRLPAVFRPARAPVWQTMGAMVAGSVLGLALLGAVIIGAAARWSGAETVAGEQARRAAALGAGAPGTGQSASFARATPTSDDTAPAVPQTSGDPAFDRILQEAEREGRLTPEQVAAISRAISGEPTFEDIRRLTEADIQRLADATGLGPEQLAPVLAQLVATGRIAMPAGLPQAVADVPVPRPAAGAPSATGGATAGQANGRAAAGGGGPAGSSAAPAPGTAGSTAATGSATEAPEVVAGVSASRAAPGQPADGVVGPPWK